MHKSVLLNEATNALHIKKRAKYIDATLGAGGHTVEILKLGGEVLGIDADSIMLGIAQKRVDKARPTLVLGNFRDIARIAKENNFSEVSGVLFDLGLSSIHFDSDHRGFSFKDLSSPLDMRLSPETQGVTAGDLLNSLPEKNLRDLFMSSMEYFEANTLARKVVKAREEQKFASVGDFLKVTGDRKSGKIHAATKPFQALRIAVNTEYDSLAEGLKGAFEVLEIGGRIVVISFHSGEDKIVKDTFKEFEKDGLAVLEKMVVPTEEEVNDNPRARSAKMRVLQKKEK